MGELAHPAPRRDDLVYSWPAQGVEPYRSAPTWTSSARIAQARAARTDDAVEPARSAFAAAERIASGLGAIRGLVAVELRIVSPVDGDGLGVYLRCRATGADDVAESALGSVLALLPRELRAERGMQPLPLPAAADPVIVELRRRASVLPPAYPPAARHYRVEELASLAPVTGDGTGWAELHRVLHQAPGACELSIVLVPAAMQEGEAARAGGYAGALQSLAHDHQTTDLLGYPRVIRADGNAGVAAEQWTRRLEELRRGSLRARIALRGAAPAVHAVVGPVAAALAADRGQAAAAFEVVDPGDPAERSLLDASIDAVDVYPLPSTAGSLGPLPGRLHYLYSTREAASLLALPVPSRWGAPGAGLLRDVDDQELHGLARGDERPAILLGEYLHAGRQAVPAVLPVDELVRHGLAVGQSGFGKTTTVRTILCPLWLEHRIPWLVVEPSSAEYRELFAGLDGARFIRVGDDDAPLRINMLAPVPGESRYERHSRITGLLKLAMPLGVPLPQLLDSAVEAMLDRPDADRATLATLRHEFRRVFDGKGYTGEARNLGIAFETRLESLTTGAAGSVLDTLESIDLDELLSRPAVISLEAVEDPDVTRLLTAVIVSAIRSTARRRGLADGLRHLTVLEEAHQLLAATDARTGGSESGDQLRAESIAAFARQIAELRKHGEGFLVVTQFPGKLVEDVIANTATHISHRLSREDDQRAMAPFGPAQDEVMAAIGQLRTGEAMIVTAEQPRALAARIRRVPPSGGSAGDAAGGLGAATLRPYALCGPEACPGGCSAAVRAVGRSAARPVAASLDEQLRGAAQAVPDLADMARRAARQAPGAGSPREAYCLLAQLHATTALGSAPATEEARRRAWETVQDRLGSARSRRSAEQEGG